MKKNTLEENFSSFILEKEEQKKVLGGLMPEATATSSGDCSTVTTTMNRTDHYDDCDVDDDPIIA